MSIIETCKEPLKTISHNSYRFFNTHNMQATIHWQSPDLHHQQILYISADNNCSYFVNLP